MSKLRKDVEALTLSKNKGRDYDPEDVQEESEGETGSGSEQESASGGREHYVKVGKSKIRRPDAVSLSSKYGAVAVSRKTLAGDNSDSDLLALNDDSDEGDDDPFAERPSKDQSEHHAEKALKSNRRSAPAQREIESMDEAEEDESEDEDEATFDEDLSDDDDDEEEGSDEDLSSEDERARPSNAPALSDARAGVRLLLSRDTQNLANGLSQAASADVRKGRAVKRQYQTFDRLLDARIKLQKGIVALDDISHSQALLDTSDADEALRKAQDAAMKLLNTIGSFRDSVANAANSSSRKRKRTTPRGGIEDLDLVWKDLADIELDNQEHRRTMIEKWSKKTKVSDPAQAAAGSKSKFMDSSHNDSLTAVLSTYIINEQDKHFREKDSAAESEEVNDLPSCIPAYDDNVFYQSLLRDLITTRAATSSAGANVNLSVVPHKLHASGNRQNKKNIDTKASKGRKIRYTVHEKLQNFMAAEGDTGRDTAMWTERGKNEFFSSLFGQDRALVENGDEDMDIDGGEENGAEVDALRLFRT